MRTALRTIVTAVLAFGLVVTGYYFYRKDVEEQQGRKYSFTQAPGDLISAVRGLFSGGSEGPAPTPSGAATGTAGSARTTPPSATEDPAALRAEGRRLYLAGDYSHALPLLERAGATELLRRARLFSLLLPATAPGQALFGPDCARIALARGEPFLAELLSDDGEELTFRRADGVGARVKKSELREQQIARTPEQKQALAEIDYEARHARAESAADFLELARFCHEWRLTDHLTYLLERGLEQPGDGIEKALFDGWQDARANGRVALDEQAVDLLKHFFRRGEYTRLAVAEAPARPGISTSGPGGAALGGAPPASGIGGVGSRSPRVSNPEINAMLAKADDLRRKANAHYLKAQPGSPDRAANRKAALAAYEEAMGLYEEIEDQWGVDLERVFKEITERRYQLLKDTPVR